MHCNFADVAVFYKLLICCANLFLEGEGGALCSASAFHAVPICYDREGVAMRCGLLCILSSVMLYTLPQPLNCRAVLLCL